MKILKQSAELYLATPNSEELIEKAGRTCYRSEDKICKDSAAKFIKMLVARGHESVLEHSIATFCLVTNRAIANELVRHRLASYSQESTRYCNYSKGKFNTEISVIEPPGLKGGSRDIWVCAVMSAENRYFELLSLGHLPQVARDVLPLCLATEIVITANFREWRTIFKQRLSPQAHPQIQELIGLVRDQLIGLAPNVFSDFSKSPDIK